MNLEQGQIIYCNDRDFTGVRVLDIDKQEGFVCIQKMICNPNNHGVWLPCDWVIHAIRQGIFIAVKENDYFN